MRSDVHLLFSSNYDLVMHSVVHLLFSSDYDVVVDAVFGFSFKPPVRPALVPVIGAMAQVVSLLLVYLSYSCYSCV